MTTFARKAFAEALGSALLACTVVGSGIAAQRLPAVDVGQHDRTGGGLWLGEVVATFGLLVVIFGVVRSGRTGHVAYAVGGYITAAYWFTSSTSFANPAITIGRTLTDTFAGIAPSSVPLFVLMQFVGAALAVGAVLALYPDAQKIADDIAHPDHPDRAREETRP